MCILSHQQISLKNIEETIDVVEDEIDVARFLNEVTRLYLFFDEKSEVKKAPLIYLRSAYPW